MNKRALNQLAYDIVGICIEVHKTLGPGLLESIYEDALCYELDKANIFHERQKSLPVIYKGKTLKSRFVLDLVVNDMIILELKSVKKLAPIYSAQLLTYMKLSKIPKGLLINFNVMNIAKEGYFPFVNSYFEMLDD